MVPESLMKRPFCRYGILSLLAVSLTQATPVQAQDPAVPQTVEDALHQMSDLAGIIFVGEVAAIRHREGDQGASGVVEVDFRIDQAVRGCSSGSSFTLREWAGLWQGGDERYHVGQRLLMMLHSPGPTGITSPVAGLDGAIPLHPQSSIPLVDSSTAVSANDSLPASLLVDLRWVGTHVLRTAPSTASSQAIGMTADAVPVADVQQTPLSTVVGMLSSWKQSSGQQVVP
jgi:hypothetical protein